ncbi:MAG: arabinan endo-1,5-alpha-L-arabinosidase [Balneolaceae bacterium]
MKISTERVLKYAFKAAGIIVLIMFFTDKSFAQHTDIRVHDPTIIQQDDMYYIFNTGRGISSWSSPDMENWKRLDPVFISAPEWTNDVVDGFRNHIWAPSIIEHDGTYYLYYSISAFGKNTSAIGVATNQTLDPDDPLFEWKDHGKVVQSVPGRDMWNAIDGAPVIDSEGTPWLAFGSFWMGLKLVQLNENMTEIAVPQEWHTIAARHRYWKMDERDAGNDTNSSIEAPFIFRKGNYYYLFASWDACCRNENSTYKIVVGRSENITGPYRDKAGENMAHGGGSFLLGGDSEKYAAIGHNSVYTFNGTDYLIAHAYDLSDEGRSKLLLREVEWDADGWPIVNKED